MVSSTASSSSSSKKEFASSPTPPHQLNLEIVVVPTLPLSLPIVVVAS
jgi:hypothetical protein